MKQLDHDLGTRLRTARERRSLSQEDLAAATGVSAFRLAQFERGALSPNMASFRALAKALDADAGWLLSLRDEPAAGESRNPVGLLTVDGPSGATAVLGTWQARALRRMPAGYRIARFFVDYALTCALLAWMYLALWPAVGARLVELRDAYISSIYGAGNGAGIEALTLLVLVTFGVWIAFRAGGIARDLFDDGYVRCFRQRHVARLPDRQS